mmetsp:Transcript_29775/g.36949  ORF Transcript_29775/g.36949 Transcript_29775/m.36949 type:complete len:191 (-) Transcript_29775:118-690(-)
MLNFWVWNVGVLGIIGLLNAYYGWKSWRSFNAAYDVLKSSDKKSSTTTKDEITMARDLQADINREWNTYAIEEIISAFTVQPLIPYWYAAVGMCEGEDWHPRCPEDWQKEVWRLANEEEERKGRNRKNKEDKRNGKSKKGKKGEKEEDYEVWEETDDDAPEDENTGIPTNSDEVVDEPVDPLALETLIDF